MKTYDVTFQREDYKSALDAWTLVDDVVAGQRAVKARGREYLPKPSPKDLSADNTQRFTDYLFRAIFYNATGRTLQGLVGAAFRKDPELNVPASLDYVKTDIDGAGVSIYQQSQSALRAALTRARHCLLVDYPETDGKASRADMASGLTRATAIAIDAAQVVNWRLSRVGALYKLTLVVIKENAKEDTEDGFGQESIEQYRVLRLTAGVGYTTQLYRKNAAGEWVAHTDERVILDGAGKAWGEIPIVFIGANNNDASIDPSPLYDMAEINLGHYRNSADYEDSAYMLGQAQPWIAGLTEEWRDWLDEKGIYLGSRAVIPLPQGAQFGIEQVSPNTLAKEAMDAKEKQLVAMGARLVTPGSVAKTATEAQGDSEVEHSVLSLAVANVSEAYTKVLGWMARFNNTAAEKIDYSINQEFTEARLDANLLLAVVQLWQSGKWPEGDLFSFLRRYGLVDPEKTDEEIRDEIETNGSGLGFE